MLLQNTTTNACESWHRQLKTSLGVDKGKVANHGMLNLRDFESHWHLTIFQVFMAWFYILCSVEKSATNVPVKQLGNL